jgi:hypothetical protein
MGFERDIKVEVGQYYAHILEFIDDLDQPIDVTTRVYEGQIGDSNGDLVLTLTTHMTEATLGRVTLDLQDVETAMLAPFQGKRIRWKVYENDAPLIEGACEVGQGLYG